MEYFEYFELLRDVKITKENQRIFKICYKLTEHIKKDLNEHKMEMKKCINKAEEYKNTYIKNIIESILI